MNAALEQHVRLTENYEIQRDAQRYSQRLLNGIFETTFGLAPTLRKVFTLSPCHPAPSPLGEHLDAKMICNSSTPQCTDFPLLSDGIGSELNRYVSSDSRCFNILTVLQNGS